MRRQRISIRFNSGEYGLRYLMINPCFFQSERRSSNSSLVWIVCFRRASVLCEASSVASISKYTPTLEAQIHTLAPAPAEHRLADVADRCERWRQTRTTSAAPLPQCLWEQAIA